MKVSFFSNGWLLALTLIAAPIIALSSSSPSSSSSTAGQCYVTIENKTGEEHYFIVGQQKYELQPGAKKQITVPRMDDRVPSGAQGDAILAGRLLASSNASLTIKQARNPCGKTFSLTKNYVLGPKSAP